MSPSGCHPGSDVGSRGARRGSASALLIGILHSASQGSDSKYRARRRILKEEPCLAG